MPFKSNWHDRAPRSAAALHTCRRGRPIDDGFSARCHAPAKPLRERPSRCITFTRFACQIVDDFYALMRDAAADNLRAGTRRPKRLQRKFSLMTASFATTAGIRPSYSADARVSSVNAAGGIRQDSMPTLGNDADRVDASCRAICLSASEAEEGRNCRPSKPEAAAVPITNRLLPFIRREYYISRKSTTGADRN